MSKSIVLWIYQWLTLIFILARASLISIAEIRFENLALRSQLTLYQQQELNNKIPKPRVTPVFRQLWVLFSKLFQKWKESLIIVKPETVIGWHKTAFKAFWKRKSKAGRPKISRSTIALINRIHKKNPLLSPEKIHEKLVSLNVIDAPSPNTIAKYFPQTRKAPTDKQIQSWKTFLKNHSKDIWAMDFLTVPSLTFKVLYVFFIISHDRRKIEHFAVTTNPNSAWVCQRLRNATPFGKAPKYLIHDNDPVFTSGKFKEFLENANIKSKRTGYHSPWQNGICERAVGILRQELLNHVIPINESHLERLLKDYIENYYNIERTHQGIGCEIPVPKDNPLETKVSETVLNSEAILCGLYHRYNKAA